MGEKEGVQVRFLIGPAGSGKTHRCIAEIRSLLTNSPDGPPLLFLSPKQATFQIERQLLLDPSLPGYTRLQILSFERLAFYVLGHLNQLKPQIIDDNGRSMVLRALITRRQKELSCFLPAVEMPGFIQQLSQLLCDCRHRGLGIGQMGTLLDRSELLPALTGKIRDLKLIAEAYSQWLEERQLRDRNDVMDIAAEALEKAVEKPSIAGVSSASIAFGGLWLDGFAELTVPETRLLTAIIPFCEEALLAFCLRNNTTRHWLSPWSIVSNTFQKCHTVLHAMPGVDVCVETLDNLPGKSRFSSCHLLALLESYWDHPEPPGFMTDNAQAVASALKWVRCPYPEAEAIHAAREIVRFVRAGGRYGECGILLRSFEGYHETIRRVFKRYSIPIFLDRRESVAHHPLAELTRYSLRTWIYGWNHEDLFGALKTGFFPIDDEQVDFLENEALAHGWKGDIWAKPLTKGFPENRSDEIESLRNKIIPLLTRFGAALLNGDNAASALSSSGQFMWPPLGPETIVNGTRIATAIQHFWNSLQIHVVLDQWSKFTEDASSKHQPPFQAIHHTVWVQMLSWVDNLAMAFTDVSLPLREWLDILEAGLVGITVGVIPPVVDQVLVGIVDRSRNPDLKLTLVLGLNEGVFPAMPSLSGLLNEAELRLLEDCGFPLALNKRAQISKEKYLGYIAFTRPRSRLVLSFSERNSEDKVLNPSSFFAQLNKLFPTLPMESYDSGSEGADCLSDIIPVLARPENRWPGWVEEMFRNSSLSQARRQLSLIRIFKPHRALSREMTEALCGLCVSVSATQLEWFAECPFKYFAGWTLNADERKRFELDFRKEGSFQHAVLAEFHRHISRLKMRWRDVSPSEARSIIHDISQNLAASYHEGIMHANALNQFIHSSLASQLQDYIEAIIDGMNSYCLDPCAVELSFGLTSGLPAWRIDLDEQRCLSVSGKIDRVDGRLNSDASEFWCVVTDYKSGHRNFDPVLFSAGIQLQLPVYLNLLRHASQAFTLPPNASVRPAGAFYSNLAGKYKPASDRSQALSPDTDMREHAYQRRGRFDPGALPLLDNRVNRKEGTQFRYYYKNDGSLSQGKSDVPKGQSFNDFLNEAVTILRQIAIQIFQGNIQVDPYQKGSTRACSFCPFGSLCRIDPWTHEFRNIKGGSSSAPVQANAESNADE